MWRRVAPYLQPAAGHRDGVVAVVGHLARKVAVGEARRPEPPSRSMAGVPPQSVGPTSRPARLAGSSSPDLPTAYTPLARFIVVACYYVLHEDDAAADEDVRERVGDAATPAAAMPSPMAPDSERGIRCESPSNELRPRTRPCSESCVDPGHPATVRREPSHPREAERPPDWPGKAAMPRPICDWRPGADRPRGGWRDQRRGPPRTRGERRSRPLSASCATCARSGSCTTWPSAGRWSSS